MICEKAKIAVIYHFFPHYRAPVLRALSQSQIYEFEFWGSVEEIEGIKPCGSDDLFRIHPLIYRRYRFFHRIFGYREPLFNKDIRALIILGNPNFVDTWIMAIIGRVFGKKVLFWSHGWLRSEPRWKAFLRNLYFSLGHCVLTYDERSKRLAIQSGFPGERVAPIYNSLDFDIANAICGRLKMLSVAEIRRSVADNSNVPLLICTARLTQACRFDLLLEAMRILRSRGLDTHLILIGDGPEKSALECQASSHGLSVEFAGSIYEEEVLGPLLYVSDLTVSPGKVGLTAIHSLMYGTPVITHDDRDGQMPEVEAIVPGETGGYFRRGDPEDLACKIADWLGMRHDREYTRHRCREIIVHKYNPYTQRHIIELTLIDLLRTGVS